MIEMLTDKKAKAALAAKRRNGVFLSLFSLFLFSLLSTIICSLIRFPCRPFADPLFILLLFVFVCSLRASVWSLWSLNPNHCPLKTRTQTQTHRHHASWNWTRQMTVTEYSNLCFARQRVPSARLTCARVWYRRCFSVLFVFDFCSHCMYVRCVSC